MHRTALSWRRSALVLTCLAALSTVNLVSANAEDPLPNAGGGTFAGQVNFNGAGVPPVDTPCLPISFVFSATAEVVLANGGGSEGAWTLTPPFAPPLTGSGSSTCENSTVGGGLLTVDPIDAVSPTTVTRLQCGRLDGAYTRTLTDLTAVVGGDCRIGAAAADKVAIHIRAEVVPLEGNSVTKGVKAATFAGTFTVVPANGAEPTSL